MNAPKLSPVTMGLIAAAVVVGVLVMRSKKTVAGVASDAGKTAGAAVVNAATGAAVGAVEAVGQAVGIPPTDADKCAAAIAEGRTWDASFACPAVDFLSGTWKRVTGQLPPVIDTTVMDRWDARVKQPEVPGVYYDPITGLTVGG